MAEKQYETEPYIKEYRAQLAKVDEIAQIALKGHLEVEASLDEAVGAIFRRKDWLKETKLSFFKNATLMRAYAEHENENYLWPLMFTLNSLRNNIAHGGPSTKRTSKIDELRNKVRGFGGKDFKAFIAKASEQDVITHAAALCRGFLLKYEAAIRGV